MKKPFTHFDLPKQHLTGEHYVPARARQADEIDRRRSLPRGTILLEQQRDGLAIMQHVLERADDERDLAYIQDILAACALNSSWHTIAQHAEQMRKRLVSQKLFDAETGEPRTSAELRAEAEARLGVAVDLTGRLVEAHVENRLTSRQITMTGRAMGTTALYVASLPLDGTPYSPNPYEASLEQRDRGLVALGRARALTHEVGSNVTMAQLPDQNSDVAVFVRRTAPNNVFNAFEEASQELRDAS